MNENQLKDEIHRRMVEHSEMKSFGVHRTASDSAAMYAAIGAMAIGTLGYIAMLFVAEAHAVFVALCCAVLGGFLGYASAPGEARTRPAGCTFFGGLVLIAIMVGLPFMMFGGKPAPTPEPPTYSIAENKDMNSITTGRKSITIIVNDNLSIEEMETAMANVAKEEKRNNPGIGAVMVYAARKSQTGLLVRGGQFAPYGDWAKADHKVPISVWEWKSNGELSTKLY